MTQVSAERDSFSHTVLGESETAWWCQYCKYAHAALKNIYSAGWYPFYYVSLETAKNKHANERAKEIGLGGMPSVVFDGGFRRDDGAPSILIAQSAYNISIRACGNRTVADLDLTLQVIWLGGATMQIQTLIINNGGSPYQGRLRAYVTEKASSMGWNDSAHQPYTFAFLEYAENTTLTIPAGGSWMNTTVWNGNLYNDGYGHTFGGITQDNIMVIAAVFDGQTKLVDETTGASPQSPNNPPLQPTPPSGPMFGLTGTSYTFSSVTTDPEGDSIYYMFDWGNGQTSPWVGPYSSGQTGSASYAWPDAGTYQIRVQAKDTGEHLSPWSNPSSITIDSPPYQPSMPTPANQSTGISISPVLSWSGGDPDSGDTVTYDVFFGTTPSPPKIFANLSSTSYSPSPLSYSTTYYWHIIAWDSYHIGTAGPLWHFTTMPQPNQLPFVPNNPVPPDDAYDVQTTPTLSWSGGDPDSGDSVTYDVYFGTNYDPVKVVSNQSETSYSPGLLSYKTQYYWRIVAWDNHGAHSDGDIWSFITIIKANNLPPNIPEDPYPANESGLISVFNYLSWTSGDPNPEDYLSFDVYFGPINPPQKVSANQTAHSYSLPPLTYDTTYYWRIVAWDDMGTSTQGPLWSFTTVPETSSLKVKISRPEGGGSIYFRDQQLVAKTKAYAPLIIGKLTVQAEIVESTFAIQKVDFFIDGARRGTDTKAPYEFLWTEHVSFGHTIEIVVTDVMNNKAFSEITVRKLI